MGVKFFLKFFGKGVGVRKKRSPAEMIYRDSSIHKLFVTT